MDHFAQNISVYISRYCLLFYHQSLLSNWIEAIVWKKGVKCMSLHFSLISNWEHLDWLLKKSRPPLCTMVLNACRWCTMQADGAQHNPAPSKCFLRSTVLEMYLSGCSLKNTVMNEQTYQSAVSEKGYRVKSCHLVQLAQSLCANCLQFGWLQPCQRERSGKTHTISWLCNVSGPMVRHNCHGMTTPTPLSHDLGVFWDTLLVIPWQLCWTIGPLLSQRFPLASAKAQPRGDF